MLMFSFKKVRSAKLLFRSGRIELSQTPANLHGLQCAKTHSLHQPSSLLETHLSSIRSAVLKHSQRLCQYRTRKKWSEDGVSTKKLSRGK